MLSRVLLLLNYAYTTASHIVSRILWHLILYHVYVYLERNKKARDSKRWQHIKWTRTKTLSKYWLYLLFNIYVTVFYILIFLYIYNILYIYLNNNVCLQTFAVFLNTVVLFLRFAHGARIKFVQVELPFFRSPRWRPFRASANGRYADRAVTSSAENPCRQVQDVIFDWHTMRPNTYRNRRVTRPL